MTWTLETRLHIGRIVDFNPHTRNGSIKEPGHDELLPFSKEHLVDTVTLADLERLAKAGTGLRNVYAAFMIKSELVRPFGFIREDAMTVLTAVNIQILHPLLAQCEKDSRVDPL